MSRARKPKYVIIILVLIALPIVAARLYLPVWLKNYVNEEIEQLENYSGTVQDIDVHLWRGAYQIHGMDIRKKQGGLDKSFAKAETIDLSVEWAALFHGAIVAEIDVYKGNLNFSKTQTGKGDDWVRFVNALTPLEIDRMELHGGKLSYTDYTADPNIYLYVDSIHAKVTNIRQLTDKKAALPSNLKITGTSIGKGAIDIGGDMNLLKDVPDFDIGFELTTADLRAFNDIANDSLSIDFQSGNIGVFGEIAAANGHVVGYVKPIATNINMVSLEQDDPLNAIWESLVSVFVELFENHTQDQFAMRIPIEGNLNDPEKDMWSAFLSIFSNAFGRAFSRQEDGSIDFQDALEQAD